MAQPTTREEFKRRILQNLGEPVVEVNVADDQVENKIDEALYFWQEYHYSATERAYLPVIITDGDKENGYITMPDTVIGVNRVIHIGTSTGVTQNLLSLNYQVRVALIDLFRHYDRSLVPYYMAMQHIRFLDLILAPQPTINFNRHTDRLYIFTNWSRLNTGEYLLIDTRTILNVAEMWSDLFLQRYATALLKYQWSENMTKWNGVQMPGGVSIDFNDKKAEARDEIERLELMMKQTLQEPLGIYVG